MELIEYCRECNVGGCLPSDTCRALLELERQQSKEGKVVDLGELRKRIRLKLRRSF